MHLMFPQQLKLPSLPRFELNLCYHVAKAQGRFRYPCGGLRPHKNLQMQSKRDTGVGSGKKDKETLLAQQLFLLHKMHSKIFPQALMQNLAKNRVQNQERKVSKVSQCWTGGKIPELPRVLRIQFNGGLGTQKQPGGLPNTQQFAARGLPTPAGRTAAQCSANHHHTILDEHNSG